MTRRKHPSGKHAYDGLDPLDAVLAAWEQPADTADMDILTRERVREASPQLGRVIDGLHLDIISSRHSLDGRRHRYDLSGFIREDA